MLERHGGTVEKFIGDAVMAVFGVPEVHEDDALRAARAAVELRASVAELGDEAERRWGARLQVRIGVNTGNVVAGHPASGQSFVSGDPVNVAARLEQAAQPGEILLGQQTLRARSGRRSCRAVEPLSLKGKAEPVPAFRLVEVLSGAPAFVRRLDSPMLGRDAGAGGGRRRVRASRTGTWLRARHRPRGRGGREVPVDPRGVLPPGRPRADPRGKVIGWGGVTELSPEDARGSSDEHELYCHEPIGLVYE